MGVSMRVNLPVVGSVKVSEHKTDSTKFYIKASEEALATLRKHIPEIGATITGSRYHGAEVPKEAFKTEIPVAYGALFKEAVEMEKAAVVAQIAALNGTLASLAVKESDGPGKEVAATADFMASIEARLAEKAKEKAEAEEAAKHAPKFDLIEGGADAEENEEAEEEQAEENDDTTDAY